MQNVKSDSWHVGKNEKWESTNRNHLLKVKNRGSKADCDICLKLTVSHYDCDCVYRETLWLRVFNHKYKYKNGTVEI